MNSVGGLSLFINLSINAFMWLWRRLRRYIPFLPARPKFPVPALLLGILASSIISTNAVMLFAQALKGENNYEHLLIATAKCTPFAKNIGSKQIVVRIDDIQSFAWTDIQKRMIIDAMSREIPLSLATIPLNLRDDLDMYVFLRKVRCNVEFALHGWDNIEPIPGKGEFAFLDYDKSYEKIAKGISVVSNLSGESVVTFVPPNNMMSSEARRAAANLGIKILSAEGDNLFDYDSTIYNYDKNEFIGAKYVIDVCEKNLQKENRCIIMLHPQDYASESGIDEEKYAEYIKLLNHFMRQGVSFVRFSDLVER